MDAKARRDTGRLRALELICDAIAVRTLMRLGGQPTRLQTAIEKTSWYNRARLGVALNEGDYPSLKEHKQVLLLFVRNAKRAKGQKAGATGSLRAKLCKP